MLEKNAKITVLNRPSFYAEYMTAKKALDKAKNDFVAYDEKFKDMFNHRENTKVVCSMGNIQKKTMAAALIANLDKIKVKLGAKIYEKYYTKTTKEKVKIVFNFK